MAGNRRVAARVAVGLGLLVTAVAVVRTAGHRPVPAREAIRVSGNIEVTDAVLGFRVAGRLQERRVSEGERVATGQVVARLESRELEQECELRRAEVAMASAALGELEAGARPEEVAAARASAEAAAARLADLEAGARSQEIAAASAAVEGAVADERHAHTELARVRVLREAEVAASQELDRAQVEHERTVARLAQARQSLALLQAGARPEQVAQARAQLEEARQRAELIRLGPRAEAIAQARARLHEAQAALALAETRLGYATLTSPLTGMVLADHAEAGEYVAPGTPVVTVGELQRAWLRAYLEETALGSVKLGQAVEVSTDTYPGKVYAGTLSCIASEAEFTPRSVQTEKERVRLVYRLKIDVPNPESELKPGMPAEARIPLEGAVAARPGAAAAGGPGSGGTAGQGARP